MPEADVIRLAVMGDAAALAQVHVASWRAAYRHLLPAEVLAGLSEEERARRWEQILTQTPQGTLVAEAGGRVVGFASIGPNRDADAAPRSGELYALYVEPELWGRGIGLRLWNAALEALLVEDYVEVTLWVLEDNPRARAFYERAGLMLDPGGRQVVDVYGTPLPELRYRRRLV
jgi:ribosomal protein S18 acetylase RimI-like enzyme